MRFAKTLCCALAVCAMLAPAVRADDYTKLTYFTFSGPVQVPGVTLPAGTYMFKLADPESGRRAIQIWAKDGSKLYTTLLTMTNERLDIPKEPMVMFREQPTGEAPAVRVWYYEGTRAGYEFVYPKDQAARIAKASHTPVLAMNTGTIDPNGLKSATVGRVDDTGQFSQTTGSGNTDTSANRSAVPAAAATAQSTTSAAQPTPANASQSSTIDERRTMARNTERSNTLPATASLLPLAMLLSGLSLTAAFGMRQLRKRQEHV